MPNASRALSRFALLALLVATAGPAHPADLQLQFKSWVVTCGGDRYCTAATRLKGNGPELPYAFRLRVTRYQSGEREIVFLPARERPRSDSPLHVRVDGRPAVTLTPGTGYRTAGNAGGNTYVTADQEATAALIESMRTGKRVDFEYLTAHNKPVVASFPLDGFAAALAVVDPQYARSAQRDRAPPQAAQTSPAPQAARTSPAPQAAQTNPAPQAAQTNSAPQAAQTNSAPQAAQTSPVPQAAQTSPAPHAAPTNPTPQAVQTSPAPQAAQTNPAPQAAQTSPAPPAAAEPVPQARAELVAPGVAVATVTTESTGTPDVQHAATRSSVEAPPPLEPVTQPSTSPAPEVSVKAPKPAASAASKRAAKPAPARSAAASPPPPGRKRQRAVREFSCRGDEPAWNFIVDNDQARFELLLGGPAPEAIALKGKLGVTGEGRTPDVSWRGRAADKRTYRALIQQQQCTDGISDAEAETEFAYRIKLTLPGGRVLQGCCNAGLEPVRPRAAAGVAPAGAGMPDGQPAAGGQTDPAQAPRALLERRSSMDWSRLLMELMPAIDACIARTPGSAAYVTKAWVSTLDSVVVRTRNATVGWFECTARSDGGAVDAFEAVQSSSPIVSGEELVLYTPVAAPPPAGNCFTHERVVDMGGEQIGWLSNNTCAAQTSAATR